MILDSRLFIVDTNLFDEVQMIYYPIQKTRQICRVFTAWFELKFLTAVISYSRGFSQNSTARTIPRKSASTLERPIIVRLQVQALS